MRNMGCIFFSPSVRCQIQINLGLTNVSWHGIQKMGTSPRLPFGGVQISKKVTKRKISHQIHSFSQSKLKIPIVK